MFNMEVFQVLFALISKLHAAYKHAAFLNTLIKMNTVVCMF